MENTPLLGPPPQNPLTVLSQAVQYILFWDKSGQNTTRQKTPSPGKKKKIFTTYPKFVPLYQVDTGGSGAGNTRLGQKLS